MIGLVAATANGRRNAAHLLQAWPDARLYEGEPKVALRRAWGECDGIVLFLATGAAVRLVSSLLRGQARGPRRGLRRRRNALRRRPRRRTRRRRQRARGPRGRVAGRDAGRDHRERRRWRPGARCPRRVARTSCRGRLGPRGGRGGAGVGRAGQPGLRRSLAARPAAGERRTLRRAETARDPDLRPPADVPRPAVVYRPPSLVAGIGCSRGVGEGEILALLRASLPDAGLAEKSVATLASVDAKSDEAGLLEPPRNWVYPSDSTPRARWPTFPSRILPRWCDGPSARRASRRRRSSRRRGAARGEAEVGDGDRRGREAAGARQALPGRPRAW